MHGHGGSELGEGTDGDNGGDAAVLPHSQLWIIDDAKTEMEAETSVPGELRRRRVATVGTFAPSATRSSRADNRGVAVEPGGSP